MTLYSKLAASIVALLSALLIRNNIVYTTAIIVSLLLTLIVFALNLNKLSEVSEDNPKSKTLKFITLFNIIFVIALIVFAVSMEKQWLQVADEQGKYIMAAIVAVPMLVLGNVAPKIPFNRYTGLRLPWTVRDEETWLIAHRVLGYLSFPCAMISVTGATMSITLDLYVKVFFFGTLLVWIGIPAILSGAFFYKKCHIKR